MSCSQLFQGNNFLESHPFFGAKLDPNRGTTTSQKMVLTYPRNAKDHTQFFVTYLFNRNEIFVILFSHHIRF